MFPFRMTTTAERTFGQRKTDAARARSKLPPESALLSTCWLVDWQQAKEIKVFPPSVLIFFPKMFKPRKGLNGIYEDLIMKGVLGVGKFLGRFRFLFERLNVFTVD